MAFRPRAGDLLEDLDVLILDALRWRPHTTHFSLPEAIDVARQLRAKRTIFTHIGHELEHDAVSAQLPPAWNWPTMALRIAMT